MKVYHHLASKRLMINVLIIFIFLLFFAPADIFYFSRGMKGNFLIYLLFMQTIERRDICVYMHLIFMTLFPLSIYDAWLFFIILKAFLFLPFPVFFLQIIAYLIWTHSLSCVHILYTCVCEKQERIFIKKLNTGWIA